MSKAMTEICAYLKNWFDKEQPKIIDKFTISNGTITKEDGEDIGLAPGGYIRIIGSTLNSGVWRLPEADGETIHLRDETFTGTVWFMAVPPAIEAIATEMTEWLAKYDSVDSPAMSPYTSESFGGYSYSKSGGSSNSSGTDSGSDWKSVFSWRLRPWKKI